MIRILYTLENLVELFDVEAKYVRLWTRLGTLPSLDTKPVRYCQEEVDQWIADGHLDKNKPKPKTEFKHEMGYYGR